MANGNNIGGNYASGLNGGNGITPTFSGGDLNIEEQNAAITQWASMVQRHLRGAAVLLTHGKEGSITRPGRTERKLEDSIRTQNRKTYGVITGQSFIFERHGVFVHKGVGRGYEMQGGMVVRIAKEDSIFSNNMGKVRVPFEWFNPVIEQSLPELADKLANINADAAVNATRMLIR
ncbi:MAG TPA: hypothetical protein VFC67_25220 [Prolixibacteraceae bacterium]|nr:hypothetical protein [Prolixibacteraceae bacterium]